MEVCRKKSDRKKLDALPCQECAMVMIVLFYLIVSTTLIYYSGMVMILKLPSNHVDTDLNTHLQIPLRIFGELPSPIQLNHDRDPRNFFIQSITGFFTVLITRSIIKIVIFIYTIILATVEISQLIISFFFLLLIIQCFCHQLFLATRFILR